MKRSLLSIVVLAVFASAADGQTPAPAPDSGALRPASAGVYTEDQAARGDTVFQRTCLSCHTPSFHADEQFRMNWLGRTVYELFKVLKTTMPEDNIGGLSDDDYTRVIAYILKLNGFPAGSDSLSADSLSQKLIKIGSDSSSASALLRRR